MKFGIQFVTLLLVSFSSFSQVSTSADDEINAVVEEELASEVNDSVSSVFVNDIKSSHWDNTVFNPYKEVKVEYPFKINFTDSSYSSPILKDKVVTSRYGWRWQRAHQGIDIDLIKGDEVVSVLDGIVRFAQYNSGHGKLVIVRHFNGLETAYAHLSSIVVKANDTVRKGQILGEGGATGNAKGSHLHLVASYHGVAINPEYLFEFGDTNKIRASELWVTKKWTKPFLHSSKRMTKLELLISEADALASLEKEKRVYVVKKGDTLSRISRNNNVSIRSICIGNNIRSTSLLKIGQKLYID
jgi:murein DD-endopeptidase MepM/ murein hydrolase activator NlpD